MLTDGQKRTSCNQCKKNFLKIYSKYSKKAFDNLVTGDETWVYYFEPKQKWSEWIWATKNARRPIIAKRTWMVKKVLYVIFFNNKGSSHANSGAKRQNSQSKVL